MKTMLFVPRFTIKMMVVFGIVIAALLVWQKKENLSAAEKMQKVQELAIVEKHSPMKNIDAEVVEIVSDTIETAEAETIASFEESDVMTIEEAQKYQPTHNLTELQAQNPDCVGWIEIDGTPVDYPIMMSDELVNGEDFYLHHTFDKSTSNHGSIYVDPNVTVNNLSIIYGHNMRDKTMFGSLKNYREDDFWAANNEVSLYGMNGETHVTPSCVISGEEDGAVRNIATAEDLKKFAQDKSVVQGELPEQWSELVVLISCYGTDTRTYVVCAID